MKTIIIDERDIRKQQYLSIDDQEKLNTLCKICKDFDSLKDLDDFSLLAIHQSLLIETGRYNDLVRYADETKKLLILFSGGITQNIVYNSGKLMRINAADFYSKIMQFLVKYSNENIDYPLLKFLYGEKWEIPLLLAYKNLLWKYGVTEDLQMVIEKNDQELEDAIREILCPGADSISAEWIQNELNKTKEDIV